MSEKEHSSVVSQGLSIRALWLLRASVTPSCPTQPHTADVSHWLLLACNGCSLRKQARPCGPRKSKAADGTGKKVAPGQAWDTAYCQQMWVEL